MNKLLMIIMLMFATSVYADINATTIDNAGWDKLSESQKAEVLKTITDKVVETNKATAQSLAQSMNDPAKLNEWVNLGKNIGLAFGGAAKELGIAVNEFINTPVGVIAMVLIIWNFMGGMIMHFVGSFLVMLVGMGFISWHYKTQVEIVEEYDPNNVDWFKRSRLIKRTEPGPTDDWKTAYMIIGLCTIIVSIIVAFTY